MHYAVDDPALVIDKDYIAVLSHKLHDKGLDGRTGSDEIDTVWDCRIAECRPTENSTRSADASTTDIARDNYDDDLEDESDPPVNINGTENNSGERTYDTEDINKNGSLDTDISFVRYRVDLSDTSRLNYELSDNSAGLTYNPEVKERK